VVGIGFVGIEAIVLNARIRDFDEGVYWQSVRALIRGEPLFSSVFASQPPAFYYVLLPFGVASPSLASLRLTELLLGLIGLAATYAVARQLAGSVAGLVAVALAATSPLYLHQSAIVQADGPAVAISMVAVAIALMAARAAGGRRDALAVATGLALALAIGFKFLAAVTLVPIALTFLLATRGRGRLVMIAAAGGIVGFLVVMLPAIGAPRAAFDQLVLLHQRAGSVSQGTIGGNLKAVLLYREVPLELLAGLAAVVAIFRRDSAILLPLAWFGASLLAVLVYHPLFAHHLVMLSLPLGLVAAVGITPSPTLPARGREILRSLPTRWKAMAPLVALALVLATVGAGALVAVRDVQFALTPDRHNAEMIAAVRAVGRPGDFWISDNPYAIAAAGRDLPGPLVDTSALRARVGLLTVSDLESARVGYHVQWLLEDSFRLDAVPGFRAWLNQHYQAMESLGGRAVIYRTKVGPTEFAAQMAHG